MDTAQPSTTQSVAPAAGTQPPTPAADATQPVPVQTSPATSDATPTTQPSQPASTAPAQPASVKPPKKSPLKKVLFIFLALLILGGVGGGAYYLGMTKPQPPKIVYKTVVLTPTPMPSPTPDPTVSWKTYSDHGFTLKYPTTWIFKEYTTQPQTTSFYDPTTGSHTGNGGSILYSAKLDVVRFPAKTITTVKAYIDSVQSKQIPALAPDFQRKTISLNGQQVEVYHIGGEGTVGWYIPFATGSGFDEFGPLTTDPAQDSIELQIVKTFKLSQ